MKKLAGNPGKRRLNEHEPSLMSALPKCPSNITGEARREWNRVSVELYDAGLLTNVDRAALAGYCRAWSEAILADRMISKKGRYIYGVNGIQIEAPWVATSRRAWGQVLRFMTEFGMTPSARSRVKAVDPRQMKLEDVLFGRTTKVSR
jgi:P27 family predicted phage terminase small subunit